MSELTTLRLCAERGGRMGEVNSVGASVRERVHCGSEVGTSGAVAGAEGASGRGQIFTGRAPGREPENLEN